MIYVCFEHLRHELTTKGNKNYPGYLADDDDKNVPPNAEAL